MTHIFNRSILLDPGEHDEGGGTTIADEVSNIDSSAEADAVFEGDSFVQPADKGVTNVPQGEPTKQPPVKTVAAKQPSTKLGQQPAKVEGDVELEPSDEVDDNGNPVLKQEQLEGDEETHADEKAKPRDYKGFKEEDIAFLKKQPNAVFSTVAPVLKEKYKLEDTLNTVKQELQTLKADPNRIPENWYENEQAFQLTPEYTALNTEYSRHEMEASHWEKQRLRVSRGAEWQPLLGFDKATGSYKLGPMQASPEEGDSRDNLLGQMGNAVQQSNARMASLQSKADSLQNEFKQRHNSYNTYYDEAMEARFSKMPKELAPKKEQEEQLMNIIHPSDKNRGVAKLAAKLFSVAVNQAAALKALRGQQQTNKIIKDDRRVAGPPNKSSVTGSANGKGNSSLNHIGKDGKVIKGATIDFGEIESELVNGEQ